MLPNLIVIGAAKSGTTSLHYYLGLHPEIAMSREKELRFFSHDRHWRRGRAWYESQFVGPEPVHGEASPSYTMQAIYPHAAKRMHDLVPQAKLIYIVRDPVARTVSHYQYARATGREDAPFAEAVKRPNNRYIVTSSYHEQISRYLELFAPSQLLIVSMHDLIQDPRTTLPTIFRFLGVTETFWTDEFGRKLNETTDQRARSPLGKYLGRLNRLGLVHRIPMRWRLAVGKYAYRPLSRRGTTSPVSDAERAGVADQLRADITRFRAWTGRSFSEWSI